MRRPVVSTLGALQSFRAIDDCGHGHLHSVEVEMSLYQVQNQWGGSSAPWNQGGKWIIGTRSGQNPVALNVTSSDGGKTLTGTMTYAGEGPIGFEGTIQGSNNYEIQNQWGGSSAGWHEGGFL